MMAVNSQYVLFFTFWECFPHIAWAVFDPVLSNFHHTVAFRNVSVGVLRLEGGRGGRGGKVEISDILTRQDTLLTLMRMARNISERYFLASVTEEKS